MKKAFLTYFVSVLILLAVAFNDLYRIQSGIILFTPQLREILIACVLFILVLRVSWHRSGQNDLIAQLQGLGFAVIGLWFVNFVLSQQLGFEPDSLGTLAMTDQIVWSVFASLIVVILMRMLYHLMALIYVQQGQHTERNIRLFFMFVFLAMLYKLFRADPWDTELFEGVFLIDAPLGEKILFGLVLLFAFILGFRCKWLNYLRRGQKWGIVFFGAFIYPFSQIFIYSVPQTIQPYSNLLYVFSTCVLLFWTVYGGMALIGLLLQLPTAGLMDRRTEEIQTLQNLSSAISSLFQTDELIEKTTDMARHIVSADYAWIELKNGDTFELAGFQGIRQSELEKLPLPGLASVRDETMCRQDALLINHLGRDKRTVHLKKWKPRTGSLLASRLAYKEKVFGVLYAACERTFCFAESSRGMFQAFANQVAIALENIKLVDLTIQQQVYREELRLAHDAQMRLLPRSMPEIEGAEVEGLCMTANDIGGDFYDVISVGTERFDLIIGDVSGKGPDAAFYMAELKGVVQTLAHLFTSPKEILSEMNSFIRNHFESGMFVTMVYMVYYPQKRSVEFARAGHTPVIRISGDKTESFEPDGLGLGLAETPLFRQSLKVQKLKLKSKDKILLYTDGLIEARDENEEEFGEDQLEETLIEMGQVNASDMVAGLRDHIRHFCQNAPMHDDMTLLLLNVTE